MINVEFIPKGTKVYSVVSVKIKEYIINEVYINVRDTNVDISYKLEDLSGDRHNTHLNHNQVFENLDDLKSFMLKQFDELKPQTVGKDKKEEQQEPVSQMAETIII